MTQSTPKLHSLYVIYDADGTTTGELIYLAKKLLGIAHCAACDITHGPRREKPEFTKLKSSWPVPVYNIHRDEMDSSLKRAVHGVLPCVVARTDGNEDVVIMTPDELQQCQGDVVKFANSCRRGVEQANLEWPENVAACGVRIADVDEVASVSSNGDAVVPRDVF